MRERLLREIGEARRRVYAVARPTPLHLLALPGPAAVYVKREDLSPIRAYKWRGAFNRLATLSGDERGRGVVCASAGNHAQGVALAARRLDIRARIFVPESAPQTKRRAVQAHGKGHVELIVSGANYDAAAGAAAHDARTSGRTLVHPFDDLAAVAGQGTLADEVARSGIAPLDVAFLQIGGGGLAAGVACILKAHYPRIRIVGVEGQGQASMAAAVRAGRPVALKRVDGFCDGTAVRKAGRLTHALCADLIDEFITVGNDEVCAAVRVFRDALRCIPEPSGALGLAGLLRQRTQAAGKRVLLVLSGANVDADRIAGILERAEAFFARAGNPLCPMIEALPGLLSLSLFLILSKTRPSSPQAFRPAA